MFEALLFLKLAVVNTYLSIGVGYISWLFKQLKKKNL